MGFIGRRPKWVSRYLALALVVGFAPPPAAVAGPAQIGAWTAPFEEGGAGQPRCVQDPNGPDGQRICKPAAVSVGVLPDGRVWYSDGFNGTDSWRWSAGEVANRARPSASRVLDLRSRVPVWSTPTGPDMVNPAITPGSRTGDHVPGVLGAPGEPGGGFTGSLWGELGGPSFDPTDPPDDAQNNDSDMFCSDLAQLADGRILLAGGTDFYNEPGLFDRDRGDPEDFGMPELEGIRISRTFDPGSDEYRQAGHMRFGRWYPTLVTLPNGEVSVFSGVTKVLKNGQLSQVRRTETFDPVTSTWRQEFVGRASETSLPLVARLSLMPNGKILYTGAGQAWNPVGAAVDQALWSVQAFWDPETKTWSPIGIAPYGTRNGSAQVLLPLEPPYDRATVMDLGGTPMVQSPGGYLALPLTTLTTVTADGTVTNSRTGDLRSGRWYPSAVTLPTGEVLALSGADRDGVVTSGTEIANRTPELYDPLTGTWTPLAPSARDRTYHNSAVLLPDGRVLVGGHAPWPPGIAPFVGAHRTLAPGITAENVRDPSFEIFSPPYLFRGPRPRIASVQRGIRWDEHFEIATPDADDIESVVLSRLPSPQHVIDPDARTVRLAFERSDGRIVAKAPPGSVDGSSIAPPGDYYLFVLKSTPDGPVPSVARIVRLGLGSDPTPTQPIIVSDDPAAPDTSIGATND